MRCWQDLFLVSSAPAPDLEKQAHVTLPAQAADWSSSQFVPNAAGSLWVLQVLGGVGQALWGAGPTTSRGPTPSHGLLAQGSKPRFPQP